MEKKGFGSSFGTFGEILQGELINREKFLVTLPIDRFAHCTYSITPSDEKLEVEPKGKAKTKKFVMLLLEHLKLPVRGTFRIESDIPIGKGLASSSADLVASARAICDYYQIVIPTPIIEEIMFQVEPSDGVIHDGVVSYFYIDVKLHKKFGNPPPMVILSIDEGGEVDTQKFNLNPKEFLPHEKMRYGQLLAYLETAIVNNDLVSIGKIATESALLNQRFLKKKLLNRIIQVNNCINGLGVITTHSGTCLGILLDKNSEDLQWQIQKGMRILSLFGKDVAVYNAYSHLEGPTNNLKSQNTNLIQYQGVIEN